MLRLATTEVNVTLGFFDRLAQAVSSDPKKFGLNEASARAVVSYLDASADDFEVMAFGPESFERRRIEAIREAKVQQSNSDEHYVDTFERPNGVIQRQPDEPYVDEFNTDISSEVRTLYPTPRGARGAALGSNPFERRR